MPRHSLQATVLAALVVPAIFLRSTLAMADPPPKVCVVVVGDPDADVRASAMTLADSVEASPALRGVADPDARAALRGERPVPEGMGELATARRTLHGVDQDATVLLTVGRSLGCALVVELASRPATTTLRVYDIVHETWNPAHDVTAIDSTVLDRWIIPVAHPTEPASVPAPPAPPDNATPAASPPAPGEAHDARVATPAAPAHTRSNFLVRYWPWFVAGAVIVGVFAVFAVTQQQDPSNNTVRISVVHPAAP